MTKAEKFAMQEYPPVMVPIVPESYESTDEVGKELKEVTVDANEYLRRACALGYKQAEKDLAPDPQETELNATAYLTELGYTIIPPDAKFSPANVATLAKHLLVWAENAARDYALSPEDVSKIFNKVRELQVKYPATEACFEEVAEWFNEQRETDETKNC